MRNILRDKKGLTYTELLVAVFVSVIIITAILSVWLFAYKMWISEQKRTLSRLDLLKAGETIKRDIRRSSATYMSFYPEGTDVYTAVSLPVATADAGGLYSLNAKGEIDWASTVIYHVFTDAGGKKTLRRTVVTPRNNTMDYDERYSQLESVVTSGSGGTGSTTDTSFMEDPDSFEIRTVPAVFDFYEDSSDPVGFRNEVFGWARLDAGDHSIRFEVIGKDGSSTGYGLGIDFLKIEPCGQSREAEYYNSPSAHMDALETSGEAVNRVYGTEWDNDNYLEYDAAGEGDYIEFMDAFDLWRESTFENCSKNNTAVYTDENDYYGKRVVLELPWGQTEQEITWRAHDETGDTVIDGKNGDVNSLLGLSQKVVLRTIVESENIDAAGDFIRVKFQAHTGAPLLIEKAYITRQDDPAAGDFDGLGNQDPSGRPIEEYHMHQQLFFKDIHDHSGEGDPDKIISQCWLPADSADSIEMWSEWTAFPLIRVIGEEENGGTPVNYLITIYLSDLSKTGCTYWEGTSYHTYYLVEGAGVDPAETVGIPLWSGSYSPIYSEDIFAVTSIEKRSSWGHVESNICDTSKDNPSYGELKWVENSPSGTEVLLKARSSDSEFMEGVAEWADISGSVSNPQALSIGSGRYVQFLAEISTEPFWEAPGEVLSYEDYVDAQ
ncbi:MAG: hypothetical protein WBD24_00865, partial [Candidatus Omnitrophota bacterium]